MRLTTYWIYFIASDMTEDRQEVTAFNLRDAIIKASAKQLNDGKDCNFYKAGKEVDKRFHICFDYGQDDPSTLTY